MPQLQVVDTTERPAEPTGVEKFFSQLGKSYKDQSDRVEIGKLLEEYKTNREDANAWENLQLGLEKSNLSPTTRLQTQASLNEMRKQITEKDKALNAKVNKGILTQEEKERQKGNLIKAGWPEYAAELYLDAPPGVKQTMEREHSELTSRGLRSPLVSVPEGVDQPTGNTDQGIESQEWPSLPTPNNITPSERVKWENSNEKENIKELKEVQQKKKAYRDTGLLISSMSKINDSKKLPKDFGKLISVDLDSGDIRPTAQLLNKINPETELYVKNLKQFLKGAKEFFGSRVTNFDVSSFMQQLPTLLNSEQGRRVILKQMDLVNQLEAVHANELDKGIKHYGRNANYIDISSAVDDKIADKQEKLIGRINQVVEASNYLNQISRDPEKFRGTVLMEKDGKFKAVRKEDVEKARAKDWSEY